MPAQAARHLPEVEIIELHHEKKVDALFTDALRAHLAKHGFDPLMGARPMQRLIQDTIRRALADELLFGKLMNGFNYVDALNGAGAFTGVQAPLTVASRNGLPICLLTWVA